MRFVIASLALCALLLSAPSAFAQVGSIGVYADAAGTVSEIVPQPNVPFDVYVVMFEEALVNAVAYKLEIPGLNTDIFLIASSYGPQGGGINIPNSGGENVGLGECAVGFGGNPILVATYTLLMTVNPEPSRTLSLGPNVLADPDSPIYSDCLGVLHDIPAGASLKVGNDIVPVLPRSWGGVKAIYR